MELDYGVTVWVDEETKAFTADLFNFRTQTLLVEKGFGTVTKTRKSLIMQFRENALKVTRAPRWKTISYYNSDLCGNQPALSDHAPDSGSVYSHGG